MNMIIGTREMIRIRPDGSKSTIVLEIGKPEPLLEGDKRGNWFSTSRITGISDTGLVFIREAYSWKMGERTIRSIEVPVEILEQMSHPGQWNLSP